MTEVIAHFTNSGSPLTSPAALPLVDIRRTDTGALVTAAATMFELGGGSYRYTFAATPTLEYSARADGDPTGTNSLPLSSRYAFGGFSGISQARIETDIPQILTEIFSLPAAIDTELSGVHGAGSWATATGFAVPGNDMGLTPTALIAINSTLSVAHGAGSWDGITQVDSIAAAVDVLLSANHGAGPWNIATNVDSIAIEVNGFLSVAHGAGAWTTALGFAVPGDAMNLTPAAIDSIVSGSSGTDVGSIAAAVDALQTINHGAGSWATALAVVATNVDSIAAETAIVLGAAHGSGSWLTATTTVVQLGMLSLGYTALRAGLIDNLDGTISGLSTQITGLNNISVQNVLDGVVDATGATTITVQKALQFSFASLVNTVLKFGQVYVYHDVGGSALWAGFDNDPISWGSSLV